MPRYDYFCAGCDVVFEYSQRITEPPIESCPDCDHPVKRVITSAPQFILKGQGWPGKENKRDAEKQKVEKKYIEATGDTTPLRDGELG